MANKHEYTFINIEGLSKTFLVIVGTWNEIQWNRVKVEGSSEGENRRGLKMETLKWIKWI